MANRSLHNVLKFSRGMSPVAATTDNTAYVSQIIDMKGYDAAEFVWAAGSIADVDVTFTVLVEHGDNSGLSDNTAVPDDQLTNTEASAAPTFGSDNAVGSIGYLGDKRYVRVTITPAANSGNIFLAGVWIQGNPSLAPTV
jgi:hypothetical protein